MKQAFKTIAILFFLFTIVNKSLYAQEVPVVKQGVIDLSSWNFNNDGTILLQGEWEFYQNQLLEPSDFKNNKAVDSLEYVTVPGNWNSGTILGKAIPAHGYATYRLLIKVKKTNALILNIQGVSTSYKLWINNVLKVEVGTVGKTEDKYSPKYQPNIYPVNIDLDTDKDSISIVEVVMQVSNFKHTNSGIWETIELGNLETIKSETKKTYLYKAGIIGILLIIAIYHFGLYFLRRDDLSSLLFGFFAFVMAVRGASTGNRILIDLFPNINFEVLVRLEYLSAYTNMIFVALFFYYLFRKDVSTIIIKIIVGLGTIVSVIIIFSSINFFTSIRDIFNLYVFLVGIYITFIALIKAIINKRQSAILAFIGMFLIFGTSVFDIIKTILVLPIPYLAPFGLVLYVLIQSFIISKRSSVAFSEKENLSKKLNFQNKNLEKIVEERTSEINKQKIDLKEKLEELLTAEEELKQNNEELNTLNDNIAFQKNKLEEDAVKLKGQAALAEILKNSTEALVDISEFLQKSLDIILALPWLKLVSKGSIFITNSDGNLKMVAEKDLGILVKKCAIIKPGQCLCGKALERKKMLFCNNIDHQHEIRHEEMTEHGHYNIPLMVNDDILGVLNLYVAHKHVKTEEEEYILKTIADTLASVIQRTTLRDKLRNKTEELRKYYIALEQSPSTIVFTDLKGRIQYANPKFTELTGYKVKEAIGKNPSLLKSGKTPKHVIKNLWDTIKKGEVWRGEFINLKKDGTEFIESANISPVKNSEGEIISYIAIKEDITDFRKAQEIIKRQNRQQQILIDNLPAHIYFKNINLEYMLANNSFCEFNGVKPNEIIGKKYDEIASNKNTEKYLKFDKQILKTKQPILNHEEKRENSKGEFFWTSTSKVPYLSNDGNVAGIIGIIQDITERKILNEKLVKLLDDTQTQKEIIEYAHKNITDSINYAKTIQDSLLPNSTVINDLLGEHFVLFKPKEAVSGDFFYVNKIDNIIVFAAADCTGHGVPGAFMTMLSISFLNEIIRHDKNLVPANILEQLRERILNIFAQFGSKNSNGLDIALCALNTDTNVMQYAGAYNPLIIIRDSEMVEYKATRAPVGDYPKLRKFENNEIKVQKDDLIYLFSDGYIDQLGGERMRRFSKKRMKELLMQIHKYPMDKQKEIMEEILAKWQNGTEQVDDIVFMGIKRSF